MSKLAYFDLSIPAPRRLAMMRRDFAAFPEKFPHCPEYAKPASWRDVRGFTLRNYGAAFCTLAHGANSGEMVWYAHTGPQFGDEYADEIARSIGHNGWFCDVYGNETARGIVGRLPHGRSIAGYELTDSGERVYYAQVFSDRLDAALMADEHARVVAEKSREYDERWHAAEDLREAIESRAKHLREMLAIRNVSGFDYARDDAARDIAFIRDSRERLSAEFSDIEA